MTEAHGEAHGEAQEEAHGEAQEGALIEIQEAVLIEVQEGTLAATEILVEEAILAAEETLAGQEKSMTQYVLSADRHARCHSSLKKTGLFTARNAFRKENLHTNHS